MANCVNKNHPDWKALVNKHGERIATRMYLENGSKIPSIDIKSKKVINEKSGLLGSFFNSKDTLDSLENHPKVAAEIITEMNMLYPHVKVFKDAIVDENGNYINIPSGKTGMHYKSAVLSAVAWSNDSHMETVPHEYAHEYIEMYSNTDIVKGAIEKYGKERLVTLMGRKYAGNKMSNSFEKFLNNFWKMIRNTFGAPSVVDILTDSFAKNETLGVPTTKGTAIFNYQDVQSPMNKATSVMEHNKEVSKNTSQNKVYSKRDARDTVTFTLKNKNTNIRDYFQELSVKIRKFTKLENGSKNYALIDNSILDNVNSLLADKDVADKIQGKIVGRLDVVLNEKEQQAYDSIMNSVLAYEKAFELQHQYIDDSGNKTSAEVINEQVSKDVNRTQKQHAKNLESKNPLLKNIGKLINKHLSFITNTRQWAKYLSGGENTLLSKMLYKIPSEAETIFNGFKQKFDEIFSSDQKDLYNGSIFHNPNTNINDLKTTTIKLDKRRNIKHPDTVQITEAEKLMIYLMNRRESSKGDLRKGFRLDSIEGRDLAADLTFKLTDDQISSLNAEIESNKDMIALLSEIDQAMDFSHSEANKMFKLLNGYELPKEANYFPSFHGSESSTQRKQTNVVEDMGSFRLKKTEVAPVRLVDPFQVLAGYKMTHSAYVAYAVPIRNANMMLNHVRGQHKSKDNTNYIESLQGSINLMNDSGSLYSTQGDSKISKTISKLQGNFAVAVLSKNLGVVMKQGVSLEAAAFEINRKYFKKAGVGLGFANFANPFRLFKQLKVNGMEGETKMPVEWDSVIKDPDYAELINDPIFKERFGGVVSKEAGEAIMGKELAEDKIKVPYMKNKDGSPMYITKKRLMLGITIMDTLTILDIYKAVKEETKDRMHESEFKNLSEAEVMAHNIARLKEVTNKTQPTFNQLNRTGLSQSSNPMARTLTMFSSATSKIGMALTESLIDYANNPTPENARKLLRRTVSVAVTTSLLITTIDLARHAALRGWTDDDDEELMERYFYGSLQTTLGSIQGVGTLTGLVISNLDSNPWHKTVQHPVEHIMQESADAIANVAKGNIGKATHQILGVGSKSVGLPFSIYNNTEAITKRIIGE